MKICLLALSSALILAACTQEKPANIVHKGNNVYTQQVVAHLESLQSTETPALAITKRAHTQEIFMTDNMSAAPIQTEEEFRRVVDNIKAASMQAEEPVTIVAIPVAKPTPPNSAADMEPVEVADYGPRGLESIKPLEKPTPPQWYAQRADDGNTTEGFIWPIRGKIVSTFGNKQNGVFNDGINISAPEGKEIKVVADGEVVYAGNELEGYGNMLIVRHNNGWMSAYAHTQKMLVGLGSLVSQGQSIALVGKTGDVRTAQLHFGLRKDKQAVNPMDFLTDSYAANY